MGTTPLENASPSQNAVHNWWVGWLRQGLSGEHGVSDNTGSYCLIRVGCRRASRTAPMCIALVRVHKQFVALSAEDAIWLCRPQGITF